MRRLSLVEMFGLIVILNLVSYPGIFLFLQSPLVANSWTLQDPLVSTLTFMPGIKTLRFELFEDANILWSSLRNMGAPILSNDVQAAPLFPLTLAFVWLPDPYYWNAFVIARLLLMWMGSFLLASHILRFQRVPALVFTIIFVGTVFVARWINHPWQNGLMAGIWLTYFLTRAHILAIEPWGRSRLMNMLGITVSAYALITCGFPEASIMATLLSLLVITPLFVALVFRHARLTIVARVIQDAGLGVFSGAMLASAQLFALLEHVSQTAPDFRSNLGLHQFTSLNDLLNMITRFQGSAPSGEMIQIFGLIPLTLFIVGILSRFSREEIIGIFDAVGAGTLVLYLLKCFPIWPAFNELIGGLPLLRHSLFTVYFLPIALFGFAFFSARGVEFILSRLEQRKIAGALLVVIPSIFLVIVLLGVAARRAPLIEIRYFGPIILVFFLFLSYLVLAILGTHSKTFVTWCGVGIIISLLQESYFNKPASFVGYRDQGYAALRAADRIGPEVRALIHQASKQKWDIRESSGGGAYLEGGVATVDDGATAILSQRAQAFRTNLFNTDWNGLLPLKSESVKDAFRIAGRNLLARSSQDASNLSEFSTLGRIEQTSFLFDENAPGRAFVATRCLRARDAKEAAEIIKNGNLFRVGDVVIEELSDAEARICDRSDRRKWKNVHVAQDHGSLVRLAGVEGPAILTLNDSFYPGWRAQDRISGTHLSIKPGNINFRTVLLPEAKMYELEFLYRPSWLTVTQIMIGGALLSWLVVLLYTCLIRQYRHSIK